jgi:hypothetical protein
MLMIWPSLMNVGPSRSKLSTATCNHTTNLLRIQCLSPDAHDLAQLDECGAQPLQVVHRHMQPHNKPAAHPMPFT